MTTYFQTARCSLPLGCKTHLVGILNLTPDSFSDGGDFTSFEKACEHFQEMVLEGASLIDVGGESTRPGHTPVTPEEEICRTAPFIQKIRPKTDVLISIDTSKAEVAHAALLAGADIVNDVWGAQRDPAMAATIAEQGAACILMHNRPSTEAGRGDIIDAIRTFLEKSVEIVTTAGVSPASILLDPGLGFGKSYEENWMIMRRLPEINALGFPVLLGASRKSMIARLLGIEDPKERLNGTLATTALAVQAGIDFIRVHDVRENRESCDVLDHCLRYEPDND